MKKNTLLKNTQMSSPRSSSPRSSSPRSSSPRSSSPRAVSPTQRGDYVDVPRLNPRGAASPRSKRPAPGLSSFDMLIYHLEQLVKRAGDYSLDARMDKHEAMSQLYGSFDQIMGELQNLSYDEVERKQMSSRESMDLQAFVDAVRKHYKEAIAYTYSRQEGLDALQELRGYLARPDDITVFQ